VRKTTTPLRGHLGYWLRLVSNHVSQAFGAKLAERNVSVAEWVILRVLFEERAATPSHLAEVLGVTRGAISRLADRLIARALIGRAASENDRRSQALSLTPAGQALVPELTALADRNDAEFFGHLTPAGRRTVEEAMKEIARRHAIETAPAQ
jgi:DNA-binding MarR family transcriptional regulator